MFVRFFFFFICCEYLFSHACPLNADYSENAINIIIIIINPTEIRIICSPLKHIQQIQVPVTNNGVDRRNSI